MGLDITWYRQLKPAPSDVTMENFYERGFVNIGQHLIDWSDKNFDGPRATGLSEGFYDAEANGHFAAGSCSSYGDWRDRLAVMAHGRGAERIWRDMERGELKEGPFVEIIHFADNEGYFGPVVSAKLAKDFVEWQKRAREFAARAFADSRVEQNWFLHLYTKFREAFEQAADGGFVEFG